MHEGVEPWSCLRLKYLLPLHAKIQFYSDYCGIVVFKFAVVKGEIDVYNIPI